MHGRTALQRTVLSILIPRSLKRLEKLNVVSEISQDMRVSQPHIFLGDHLHPPRHNYTLAGDAVRHTEYPHWATTFRELATDSHPKTLEGE